MYLCATLRIVMNRLSNLHNYKNFRFDKIINKLKVERYMKKNYENLLT